MLTSVNGPLYTNRVAALAAIEWVWNVYPARPESSAVLLVCHAVMLVALYFHRPEERKKKSA